MLGKYFRVSLVNRVDVIAWFAQWRGHKWARADVSWPKRIVIFGPSIISFCLYCAVLRRSSTRPPAINTWAGLVFWLFFYDHFFSIWLECSLSLYFTQVYRLSHSFFHPRSRQLYQPRSVQVIGHGLHRQERRCRPRSAESIVCEEGNLSIPFPKVIHRVNPKEEEEWFPSADVTIASLDSLLQVTRQPKIRKAVNTRERKQDVL